MDMRSRIHSYFPSLSKSEQKVANVVLEQEGELIYHSVTELSEYAQVGEATIMRFCRKIGFKGYQDFKLALAQEGGQKRDEAAVAVDSDDYVSLLYQNAQKVIEASLNVMDRDKLQTAVDLLDGAKNIQFFGVGSSAITAQDAKNRLLRIGRRSEAVVDSHMQAMLAVTLGPGDVAIGFSVSGSTLDTIGLLDKAKQAGAQVIAITNHAKSPITGIADVVLLTAGRESPLEGGSIMAKISQLFVVDLLCTGLARKNTESDMLMRGLTARAVIDRMH
ncbi:MurR/RpiR family transcriptional regulator [Paenibacillus roseipurpureus]|uniref:MurR/RpiR family transcriptional regulator n=1 Tax=Paenibacillus roseopurpureus TaxID=2918901 RepID=A0AA96RM61_9BACL|nr:MurR/RpiR family transcriptional regulator [Paenibacillus sp. MBLB1832]WNR46131.1 MurR/RpiR family transcriptional regulator [Paenibacillus sp. MBLB1832]